MNISIAKGTKRLKSAIIIILSVLLFSSCVIFRTTGNENINENDRNEGEGEIQEDISDSLSPEEQQLNNYTSICNKISSEENRLAALKTHAEDKLKNTQDSDVADMVVLESLSNTLLEAMEYNNYSPISIEFVDVDVSQEITVAEEIYNHLTQINQSLVNAVKDVDDSVYEMERLNKEKMAALIWPGKTYTYEYKDYNGYVVEKKMKFGSWIRASDTENLNLAWQKAGGEGNAPDISTFSLYNLEFRGDNAVMTFATLEYTNKTSGYDFSEQNPYTCIPTTCTSLYSLSKSLSDRWQGYVYFSNGAWAMNAYCTQVSMKKNHWGPVLIAIAVPYIFGPNFDEMGDPALDDVRFSFGNEPIKISALWKTTEPIKLAECDYQEPRDYYDKVAWHFCYGKKITDEHTEGWIEDASHGNNLSLVLKYVRFMSRLQYDRGGNSEMNVYLSQLYTDFQGDITVAAESKENQGYLTVKIYGDGKLLWESEKITGASSDIHFDINVTDVHKLQIESVTDENNPGPSVAIINDIIS